MILQIVNRASSESDDDGVGKHLQRKSYVGLRFRHVAPPGQAARLRRRLLGELVHASRCPNDVRKEAQGADLRRSQ
jgi:hypothetical protein